MHRLMVAKEIQKIIAQMIYILIDIHCHINRKFQFETA